MRIRSKSAVVAIAGIAVIGLLGTSCGSKDTSSGAAPAGTAAAGSKGEISVGGIFGRTVTKNVDLGAYEAVDAFFQNINSQGGVNGYTFKFEGIDDQGDPAKFAAAVERLTQSGVKAIVSSAQTEVPGGAAQLQQSGVPYIGGNAHGKDVLAIPNLFPTGANLQNGLAAVFGELLKDSKGVTVSAVNNPAVTPAVKGITARLTQEGVPVTQTGSFEVTETDFTATAAQINNAKVKDALIYALNSQQQGIVGSLEQQGYEGSIYSGSYTADLPQQLGSYADGRFFSVQPWAALGSGEAGDKAEAVVKKAYPGVDLKSSRAAMDAWTSAEILVEAVRRLGDTPVSSEALITALNSIEDFQPTFMAPVTYRPGPGGHLDVSHCMQALKIEDGQWAIAGDDRFTCWDGSVAPT